MDREDIAELFSAFGPVSIRRVFSGFGIYADDVCFSLFLRGELYLKADSTTTPSFAAEGSSPFSYAQSRSGKVVVVNSYWRLPDRLYDDPDELAQWARIALDVARAGSMTKRTGRKASKKKAGTKPRL
jgi:DNA transformation protein